MPFLALFLLGCSTDLTPTWAFDPIWIEPAADDGIHGFQTWQIYGPEWPRRYDDRHYVCAVVVELHGLPVACDAEADCTWAWEVGAAPLETDCPDPVNVDDPLFVSVGRLALGGPSVTKDTAWPGFTSVGWVDYGKGWEVHGEAYPEALDLGGTLPDGEWDQIQPFLMVPSQSFQVP